MTPAEILSPELTEKVDALRAAEKPLPLPQSCAPLDQRRQSQGPRRCWPRTVQS
jgi:hypothetical protein